MLIKDAFPSLNITLLNEFEKYGTLIQADKNTALINPGQFVKVLPIVLSGLVKVYTMNEEKELLLYYIQPKESCIMTFTAILYNNQSKIYAQAEENSNLLLLPASRLKEWLQRFPDFNALFYEQYHQRYNDLIDTINGLLFTSLDARILKYLQNISEINGSKTITISHREIAIDNATAREVVTRILKRLETENKIQQMSHGIQLL